MPVTDGYIEFVRDLLGSFEQLLVKHMFGGAGVYSADVFFAILANGALYLKADDRTRRGYESRGLRPFAFRMKNINRYAFIVMAISGFILSFDSMANEETESKAVKAAIAWLALIDEGRYSESWDATAYYFKNAIAKEK